MVNSPKRQKESHVSDFAATQPQGFCSQCGRQFPMDNLMQFGATYVCADCKAPYLQRVREGSVTAQTMRYASFGLRFVAILIDAVIYIIASLLFNAVFGVSAVVPAPGATPAEILGQAFGRLFGIAFLVNLLFSFLYYVLMLTYFGATLGKMAVGIKIVTPEAGPISFGRATARWLCASFVEPLTIGIGYLIALFDDQNRTLHDRICGTRAIVTR